LGIFTGVELKVNGEFWRNILENQGTSMT
jgi:hypothetical protein